MQESNYKSKNPLNSPTVDLQKISREQNSSPTCRICLQEMKESQIFNVCQCKGSNSFVHEQCLIQWIKKSKKYNESSQKGQHICQICKGPINLEIQKKWRFINLNQAKIDLLEKNICWTVTIVIFLFICFFVLGLLIYLSSFSRNQTEAIIFHTGLAINILIILIAAFVFITNFMIKKDVIALAIKKKDKQQKKLHINTKTVPLQANIQTQVNNQSFNMNSTVLMNQQQIGNDNGIFM